MQTHKHKCPLCGRVWEHSDECNYAIDSHLCPAKGCKGEQFYHYVGNTSTTFLQSCCRAPDEMNNQVEQTVILLKTNIHPVNTELGSLKS